MAIPVNTIPTFHIRSDDLIVVRNNGRMYQDTRENFAADFGVSIPAVIIAGGNEQIYERGKRNTINRDDDTIGGGPLQWPEADAIIAKLDQAIAAQQTRERAPLLARSAKVVAAHEKVMARFNYIKGDKERAKLVACLKTGSLSEIENYVRGEIDADAVQDVASAKECLKRAETAILTLAKIVAASVDPDQFDFDA